jgi:hypothetical protein
MTKKPFEHVRWIAISMLVWVVVLLLCAVLSVISLGVWTLPAAFLVLIWFPMSFLIIYLPAWMWHLDSPGNNQTPDRTEDNGDGDFA